jgi:hypothetical protein
MSLLFIYGLSNRVLPTEINTALAKPLVQCIIAAIYFMRTTHLRQADLNLLVVFTVLAEERNVTRGATRLLLSQPAREPRIATVAGDVPRRSADQEFIGL